MGQLDGICFIASMKLEGIPYRGKTSLSNHFGWAKALFCYVNLQVNNSVGGVQNHAKCFILSPLRPSLQVHACFVGSVFTHKVLYTRLLWSYMHNRLFVLISILKLYDNFIHNIEQY